jgi:hypothetical protein
VEIFTFFAAVYCISHCSPACKRQRFYIVCGGVLLTLVTCSLTSNVPTVLGQFMWIDRRNDPGGPVGYFVASQSLWYFVLGSAASATANSTGDGLLVRSISPGCVAQMEEGEVCLTRWLTAVSTRMLHSLGCDVVYSCASGTYIFDFLRCERNQWR